MNKVIIFQGLLLYIKTCAYSLIKLNLYID